MSRIIIKNGMIHDAIHEEAYLSDLLIEEGKIKEIGANIVCPDAEVLDASGAQVYPGFVDAHCHLGVDGYAIRFEGDDCNEMTNILTPELRIIDAVNPMDETFAHAREGGVTCVATGPGSANVLGGTFAAIKTAGKRVDDMIVKEPVAMKCAFGENPKRCYQNKNNYSRMSTASKLRIMLQKTREYLALKEASATPKEQPKFDPQLEALIPVIQGEIPLKAHAHQANDIFTAIRIAKEFGVKLTLEHCTDGALIAEELAAEGFPVCVGPSFGHATKYELKNKSFKTPGILSEAGCHVSIITDSPVIPQEYLPLCAGLAVKNGMKEFEALKAITIYPAEHIGIEDRVGSLAVGKDADIVIADGNVMLSSTRILFTIIDGKIVYQ
ncbi:MAG: amidohydrolase [Lachnospiraceae bacterium]|nr:amidohydrolase [Candidatus Equihabitans merdae]